MVSKTFQGKFVQNVRLHVQIFVLALSYIYTYSVIHEQVLHDKVSHNGLHG